jgi:hypothetical protein
MFPSSSSTVSRPRGWRQYVSPKGLQISVILHAVRSQKTIRDTYARNKWKLKVRLPVSCMSFSQLSSSRCFVVTVPRYPVLQYESNQCPSQFPFLVSCLIHQAITLQHLGGEEQKLFQREYISLESLESLFILPTRIICSARKSYWLKSLFIHPSYNLFKNKRELLFTIF